MHNSCANLQPIKSIGYNNQWPLQFSTYTDSHCIILYCINLRVVSPTYYLHIECYEIVPQPTVISSQTNICMTFLLHNSPTTESVSVSFVSDEFKCAYLFTYFTLDCRSSIGKLSRVLRNRTDDNTVWSQYIFMGPHLIANNSPPSSSTKLNFCRRSLQQNM